MHKKIIFFILFSVSACVPKQNLISPYKDVRWASLIKGETRAKHEAVSKEFVIATQGKFSTQAASEMFRLGGNIIDAAVAASFAISVERPQSTGLGGGGFMLIHLAKPNKTLAVDFREQAPLKAHEKMYLDKKGNVIPKLSIDGPLSVGVPGLVAGLLEIHKKYGKLKRHQILRPAIELAENGFHIYPHLAKAIAHRKEVLQKFEGSRKLFFKETGEPYGEGDLLTQKDLAKTLKTISQKGKNGFYRGWVADAIVREQKKYGGLIQHQDLRQYRVKYRKPVYGDYKGYQIISMPPPSSGGVHVIQILNILESDNLKALGPYSPGAIHLTASAMQMAFADRAKFLGDPDFISVPARGLTSDPYAQSLRKQIQSKVARSSSGVYAGKPFPYESNETTHFSIIDKNGNMVASTQTINYWLGSGVVVSGTGIVLNDEMDDFSAKPGATNLFGVTSGKANAIQPKKRPLSSMSPTLVMKDGKPVLALGSPSGTRIITCVTLTILNYLEYKLPLYESVAAVRYHHQWIPDEIRMDAPFLEKSTRRALRKMGYQLSKKPYGCKVQAVAKEGEILRGVSDPRGQGMSFGG